MGRYSPNDAGIAENKGPDLHDALETMLKTGVREVLVLDKTGRIIGFLDESEITQIYHATTAEGAEPH